ncbi:MAG TPA: WD40 repeat domain-containing protein, partial [Kofleriaceae bacterium]
PMSRILVIVLALTACATVAPRFPADVQTALAHDDMRRLETERFIIYYPSARRALVDRFLARADRCAATLRDHAMKKNLAKMVIVMPDAPFNNAFVAPDALGYEQVSVIPTYSTLDFTTAFGLPPDPAAIACHELVHYVHFQHTSGFWGTFNKWFGPTYTPQLGYDPWFSEGLATHYEARLAPGLGRPVWPIFTGIYAAAYAGRRISSGELSSFGRSASVGHHYLVGSMFVRFLAERYGERPLWATINSQAGAFFGWFFPGTFKDGFSVSFGDLFDEFERWSQRTFPVRHRPPTQRALGVIGNDARYARGRDGTEAWIAEDVDAPPRLTVRDARGETLLDTAIVEVLPPRTVSIGDPLLTSGLSITPDGNEVWVTAIDLGAVYQVTRLLRWRRGERGLTEVARNLGPGATIDLTGNVYYYCEVDGDRWSLAAYDTKSGTKRKLVDMKPATFIVGAQVSPDGKLLAANVWDGTAFMIWIVDVATGTVARQISGNGTPVFDASFTTDGRVMYLGVVEGRFQVMIDNTRITDAPYAVLGAREAGGTIRFLDREGWNWELAEIALPPAPAPAPPAPPAPGPEPTPAAEQPGAPPPAQAPPAQAPPAQAPPTQAPPAPEQAPAPPPVAAPGAQPPPSAQPPPGAQPQPTWVTASPPPQPTPPPQAGAIPLYPSTPQPLPPAGSVQVNSDEPYSAFDRFFFPQVRSPTLVISGSPPPHLGLVLGGADRLELHRWVLGGYVQPGDDTHPAHYGANAGYMNYMMAPVFVLAQGGFLDWRAETIDEIDPMLTHDEEHRTRDASLSIGGVYRGTLSATIGGVYTDDKVAIDDNTPTRLYVVGPSATLQWYSAENTRYTGPRRALLVGAEAAYYPEPWSTFMGNITDLGGTLGGTLPVPLGRRHTISAFARGRTLIAPGETGLLQVGGDSALGLLWQRTSKTEPLPFNDARFPPNLRFVEPLRGYEDFAITSDNVMLGEIAWKYPLIIDRGVANVWFLPAHYLRQIDLELFAAGAITDGDAKHYDVGAAVTVRLQFLRLPLAVTYQIARRLVDDEALTQFVGIGADL